MRLNHNFSTSSARDLFLASMFNAKLHCGNYDGDDDENCNDFDEDEELHSMFDEEDYDEMHEG